MDRNPKSNPQKGSRNQEKRKPEPANKTRPRKAIPVKAKEVHSLVLPLDSYFLGKERNIIISFRTYLTPNIVNKS